MKKFVCLILSLLFLCALPACAAEDTPNKEANQGQEQPAPEKKDESFGLNETAAFKDLKFTATEIKESEGEDFFTPEEGNVFVGVRFTIENVSDEEQSVSSLLLFNAYADDVKLDYSFNAACAFSEGTLDGSIAPGKKLIGWYAVEVPNNWTAVEFEVQASWLSNSSATFVFNK